MDISGESLLEREGARAAAHGQSWRTNPFLQASNMPQATGESLGDWSRRHDAWQRGFEGWFQLGPEFARRRKEKLSADLLRTLVERRLQWLPALRACAPGHRPAVPRLALPRRHPRDDAGREWDLEDFECVAAGSGGGSVELDAQLRTIIDRLRSQYDLLGPAVAASLSHGGAPGASADEASPVPAPGADDDDAPLRAELGIRRVGWRYEYHGYRYDRLADAVAYARLERDKAGAEAAAVPQALVDEPPSLPSEADRALMARWDIGFEHGIYRLQGHRYERLDDALAQARLLAGRHTT